MDSTQQEPQNPLGLSLDFMFGRGYLWAQRQRLNDWIALESLRMESPDLQFPFDARGGLERFRHTRCLVREVEFAISEVGLGDLLTEAASHLEGFEELQVRFLEDAAHISLKLKAFGADTYLSFRAALIPPEPARADEVHLSFYDYRAYGPLPYPARLVGHELVTSLLNTPVLRASGRGASFTVGIAGDIIRLRPLKLLFLHLFPRVGWKLPNLSGVVLDSARIRPGVMTIRAVDDDPQGAPRRRGADHELATTGEGGRALAAYEAKELFAHADQALFDGQMRQALSLLANYRDIYGLHPALVARMLDGLLADPSPANIAEAESIRRELVADDPEDLQAALAAPLIAGARHRRQERQEALAELSTQLEKRRQTRDWILSELALADELADDAPGAAAEHLRQILKRDPRHRAALERLQQLYERLGERAGLEETLKRLTGVYTERQTLKRTYLQLAQHLMDREGDLAEARMYLEKVLRLDPTELEALHTLGESYVLGGEPLRALKAFGSAARAAEVEGLKAQASRLHARVGQLWHSELEDCRQALLEYRRALALSSEAGDEDSEEGLTAMERVEQLRQAARMCEALERDDEALDYWREALPILERRRERGDPGFEGRGDIEDGEEREALGSDIAAIHQHLATLYDRRNRPSAAAGHYRRILEIDAADKAARDWLESHLRQAGRPEELIALYEELMDRAGTGDDTAQLQEKLGDLYAHMGLAEEAQSRYRQILDRDPGHDEVRKKLVKLLTEYRRFGALRDALNTVMVRTTKRSVRRDISMELGRANEALGDGDRAARAYLEAMKLEAGDREALAGAVRVVEALVEERGVAGGAPAGGEPVGKLLEKLLIRWAELAPAVGEQREALLKVAQLADERGDLAAASEARERARELAADADDDGDYGGVDDRLDAMLSSLADGALDELDEPAEFEEAQPLSSRSARPTPMQGSGAVELPHPDEKEEAKKLDTTNIEAVDAEQPGTDEAPESEDEASPRQRASGDEEVEKLTSFRRHFASMIKEPAQLPGADGPSVGQAKGESKGESKDESTGEKDLPPQDLSKKGTSRPKRRLLEGFEKGAEVTRPGDDDGDSASKLRRLLAKAKKPESPDKTSESATEPAAFETQPDTVQLSAEQFSQLTDASQAGEEEAAEDGDGPMDWSFDLAEPTGVEEDSSPFGLDGESVGLDEESAIDTSPQLNPLAMARESLDEARQDGGASRVAQAIDDLLAVAGDGEASQLEQPRLVALSKELAELYYYELEDSEAALPHLERVRRLDPRGRGAETAVVNALESIYEARGNVDGRIALLEQRLAAAGDSEMATTYRLLLAQLLWDQRGDAAAARRRLDEVLDADADHEAAHRLLGDIAAHQEDWATAARHLEVVVRVAGGGIDAVETERELAELYLHRLDDPQRALDHYEAVLTEAPGDSQALEGIKECQASQGDWAGYVSSLGRELGLLIGKREGLEGQEMAELEVEAIAAALRVPASQIVADAAHIVEEEMGELGQARQLWGVTYQLWPEHVEALERRINLDRRGEHPQALADDLEAYAAMILAVEQRFEVLVEAAEIRAEELADRPGAINLYAEAIALAQGADSPPEGIDEARRAMKRLQADGQRP